MFWILAFKNFKTFRKISKLPSNKFLATHHLQILLLGVIFKNSDFRQIWHFCPKFQVAILVSSPENGYEISSFLDFVIGK